MSHLPGNGIQQVHLAIHVAQQQVIVSGIKKIYDDISAEPKSIRGCMAVVRNSPPIIAAEPVEGSYPKQSIAILENTAYIRLRQAVSDRYDSADIGSLGGKITQQSQTGG